MMTEYQSNYGPERSHLDEIFNLQLQENEIIQNGGTQTGGGLSVLTRLAMEQFTAHNLRKHSIRLENDPEYHKLSETEQNKYSSMINADTGAKLSRERSKNYVKQWEALPRKQKLNV